MTNHHHTERTTTVMPSPIIDHNTTPRTEPITGSTATSHDAGLPGDERALLWIWVTPNHPSLPHYHWLVDAPLTDAHLWIDRLAATFPYSGTWHATTTSPAGALTITPSS